MKTYLSSLLIVAVMFTCSAQNKPQKIIVDVTSTDSKVYQSVMLTMKLMAINSPNAKIEVIVYGAALPMLLKNQSTVATEIAKYIDNENIIFTACEISMSLFNVEKKDLLEGVGTIGNAIEDIVDKQAAGWGYIKSGT